MVDRLEPSGERYRATAVDDGSYACVHRCERDGFWEDELERLRNAVAIARLPEIAAAPTIRQLLDIKEVEPTAGEFGGPGYLFAIWESADVSLDEFLHDPDENSNETANKVRVNVGAALDVLHGIGLIHLDVAPNNILRVDGIWKLADLDSCWPRCASGPPTGQRTLRTS